MEFQGEMFQPREMILYFWKYLPMVFYHPDGFRGNFVCPTAIWRHEIQSQFESQYFIDKLAKNAAWEIPSTAQLYFFTF